MAYGSARAFASAFRAIGLDAEPTPPSDHRTRELGARYTSGDECYPAKVTVGDFMKVLEQPGDRPARRSRCFMPTAQGPCRFGQYAPYLRQILDANGYEPSRDPLAHQPECLRRARRSLAKPFVRTGWRALLCADLLQKLLLHAPALRGAARRCRTVYEESLADLCRTLEETPAPNPASQLKALRDSLIRSRDRFRKLAIAPRPATIR